MTTHEPTQLEAEQDRLAGEAFNRIRTGQHWSDWRFLAVAFVSGRNRAMNEVGANKPFGRPYNEAFGRWLDDPTRRTWTRGIDNATRNHVLWVAENMPLVEAWRETLAPSVRDRMNHPTTVKRAYDAAQRAAEAKARGEVKSKPEARVTPTPVPEAPLPELSMTGQRAVEAHKRKLERDFEYRVRVEVEKRLNEIHAPHYQERIYELKKVLERPRNSVMTKKEYNTILMCVHPDGAKREKEDLEEAFKTLTKYKAKMYSDEESRTAILRTLPATYEEMVARRTMKRRA